jgi:hypothetical protein
VAGDVNTFTGLQRIATGQVRVTFDTQNTLGVGRNLSTCAFTATPETAKTNGTGPLKTLRVYTAPMFASSTSVDVVTVEDHDEQGEVPIDANFSLVADC